MCIKTGWLIPVRITTKIFLYNILFKENLLSNVNFVCPIMPLLYSMNSTKSSSFILNFCPLGYILSFSVIIASKYLEYSYSLNIHNIYFKSLGFDNIVDIMKQSFCALWYQYKIEGIRLVLNRSIFVLFRYVDKLGLCCR